VPAMAKRERHAAILEIIREQRITSQEALREQLADRGFEVAQATLSRDIHELRLVKVPDAEGVAHYSLPEEWELTPPLQQLLPTLYLSSDGVGNLLVVKTMTGSASPVAVAIDWEEWPEVVGTIAGDDTILIILRSGKHLAEIKRRLEEIANKEG